MAFRYSGSLELALTYLPDERCYRVIASWTENPGTASERVRYKAASVPATWTLTTPERDLDLAAALAIRSSPLLTAAAEVSAERGVHVRRTE